LTLVSIILRASYIILLIPTLAMTAFGSLLLYKSIAKLLDNNNKLNWQKETATINSVSLEDFKPNENYPFKSKKCKVSYTYNWEGKKYFGNNIGFDTQNLEDENLNKILYNKLRYSNKIKIWVNPYNPQDSAILLDFKPFEPLVFGISFLTFPLFILFLVMVNAKNDTQYLSNKIKLLV